MLVNDSKTNTIYIYIYIDKHMYTDLYINVSVCILLYTYINISIYVYCLRGLKALHLNRLSDIWHLILQSQAVEVHILKDIEESRKTKYGADTNVGQN